MARSLRDLRSEVMYFREMKGQVIISPRAQSKKQPAYARNRDIESRLVGSEAVLYRLRRDYAAKGDLSGSLGTRDSLEPIIRRKVKRLSPKHEAEKKVWQVQGPVLGVNLERGKTEEKKQDSGFTSRGKAKLANTSFKLTTIKLGLDLPQSKHTADLQLLEQKMRSWLSYQQDIREISPTKRSERLNPATCSRTEIKLPRCAKDPEPRTKRERRRNRSYELLPDTEAVVQSKTEDKLTAQLFSPPSLASNQHSGLPKPPPLKLTTKKREPPPGSSTDKGLLPAELPSPPSDPEYHFPRLRKVVRPPAHTLPSYRLAVDYNLFRFVYKHKDRVVTQA